MLLGVIAGGWFLQSAPRIPIRRFLIAALVLLCAGLLFHIAGICPIVKRVWTPSWTLFSGGVCFLFLSAFAWILDVKGLRRIAFPLVVVGMNSIAAYVLPDLFEDFIRNSFRINLGASFLNIFGGSLEPLFLGVLTLATYWLVLFWMYRRKLFLRI